MTIPHIIGPPALVQTSLAFQSPIAMFTPGQTAALVFLPCLVSYDCRGVLELAILPIAFHGVSIGELKHSLAATLIIGPLALVCDSNRLVLKGPSPTADALHSQSFERVSIGVCKHSMAVFHPEDSLSLIEVLFSILHTPPEPSLTHCLAFALLQRHRGAPRTPLYNPNNARSKNGGLLITVLTRRGF